MTEAEEYQRVYCEHPEWWLAYLRSTDEKDHTIRVLWEFLQGLLEERPSVRILDVGAGTGVVAIALAEKLRQRGQCAAVDAVEPSPMLRDLLVRNFAAAGLADCLRQCSADRFESVRLPTESYDLVLCIGSIYGISRTAQHPCPLDRMAHLLSPRGILVLVLQTEDSPYKRLQATLLAGRYLQPLLFSAEIDRWLACAHGVTLLLREEFRASLELRVPANPAGTSSLDAELLSLIAKAPFGNLNREAQLRTLAAAHRATANECHTVGICSVLYAVCREAM
jgi:SAM-dependent methyltransferase